MLTKRSFTAITIIFSHATFLKVIPFEWNAQKLELVVLKGTRLIGPFLILSCLVCMTLYQIISYFSLRVGMNLSQQILHLAFSTVFTLASLVTINTFIMRENFKTFTNHFFAHEKILQEKYCGGEHVGFDGCGHLLSLLLTIRFSQSSLSSLLFLYEPSGTRYLYSMFGHHLNPWFVALFWLWEFCLYIVLWHTVLPPFILMVSYWYATSYWLQQMTLVKKQARLLEKDKNKRQLCMPKTSLLIYQSFQLLTREFNYWFAPFVMPYLSFLVTVTPAIGMFIYIKKYSQVQGPALILITVVSCVSIFLITITFTLSSWANSRSLKYLKWIRTSKVRGVKKTAVEPKDINPAEAIKINYGAYGYFKRGSVLAILFSSIKSAAEIMLIFN